MADDSYEPSADVFDFGVSVSLDKIGMRNNQVGPSSLRGGSEPPNGRNRHHASEPGDNRVECGSGSEAGVSPPTSH